MIKKMKLGEIIEKVKESLELINKGSREKETLSRAFTMKRFMAFVVFSNIFGVAYFILKYNITNPSLSLSRYVSRKTGQVGEITIPTFMRELVYKGYIKMYSVNKEEILDQNLKNYRTIKEFFIRKIDLTKRPIENESNEILSSPCDGRILSISEVENFKDLIIVKNIKYPIIEFLFGDKVKEHPDLGDPLMNLKKRFYQITIYLSPGDCHRYYSPSKMTVSDRIYLPGFLEPVRPNYLQRHPKTLLTNERVTLVCEPESSGNKKNDNGVLYITYVGALNVGSICLTFDDFLKTNQKITMEELKDSGNFILKYADILIPGLSKIERKKYLFYKPNAPLLFQDIDKDTAEFDIRDMIDIDEDLLRKYNIDLNDKATVNKISLPLKVLKEKLLFESVLKEDEKLEYKFTNSFNSYDMKLYKKKKSLANPKELSIENFKLSNKGVHLNKKDEMGWFNFGSTIVMIFSVDADKNINFNFREGDAVRIGQSLYNFDLI